jgi:undecaprenyl-diphosphatase
MIDAAVKLDAALSQALNGWIAGHSLPGRLLARVADANFIKTLPFIAMLLAGWHLAPAARNRPLVIQGFLGALLAIGLGRVLTIILPFRARPLHSPELGLQPVPGASPTALDQWTAFPSDHAMLFAALVWWGFLLRRGVGLALLGFAVCCIWLPRLLLGYHYLSDILAGALLGFACAFLAQRDVVLRWLGEPGWCLAERRPALFACLGFVLLMQLSMMFSPLRGLLRMVL